MRCFLLVVVVVDVLVLVGVDSFDNVVEVQDEGDDVFVKSSPRDRNL